MSNLPNAVPSSLRKPMEASKFAQNLISRSHRPVQIPAGQARAAVLSKSRFARMPQEPEDARITGVTRSLQRRLLALNLAGSLVKQDVVLRARIA